MALFSSQTVELIELLAIHAVCSLDSKDTMSQRGRGKHSKGPQDNPEPCFKDMTPLPWVGGASSLSAAQFAVWFLDFLRVISG